jgi:hypothetical protein
MHESRLPARSLTELSLYIAASPCPRCGRGPLEQTDNNAFNVRDDIDDTDKSEDNVETDGARIDVSTRCAKCSEPSTFSFQIDPDAPRQEASQPTAIINPTDYHSRIIDVGQWIILHSVILESASSERDKIEARKLSHRAAMCLEEALKFYDDEELPPASAVFTESTRTHIREHPEHFARQRLIDMRSKLPTITAAQPDATTHNPSAESANREKPWWQFWTRR